MKYRIGSIGGINYAESSHELIVVLMGDDNSQHNFRITTQGRDVNNLTIKEIEKLAIEHARQSFSNCD